MKAESDGLGLNANEVQNDEAISTDINSEATDVQLGILSSPPAKRNERNESDDIHFSSLHMTERFVNDGGSGLGRDLDVCDIDVKVPKEETSEQKDIELLLAERLVGLASPPRKLRKDDAEIEMSDFTAHDEMRAAQSASSWHDIEPCAGPPLGLTDYIMSLSRLFFLIVGVPVLATILLLPGLFLASWYAARSLTRRYW